jgi:hypothetical protein
MWQFLQAQAVIMLALIPGTVVVIGQVASWRSPPNA